MHLSQRLKFTIVIKRCPPSVCSSLSFHIFVFSSKTTEQNLFHLKKNSTSSTKSVFLEPIRNPRWLPWPLIGWDIFNFFSSTTEQNLTVQDRDEDLNVLYQNCVFWADRKPRWPSWPPNGLKFFYTAEQNSAKLDRKQDLNILYLKFVFFRLILKTRWPPWLLICLRHLRLLLWNHWT